MKRILLSFILILVLPELVSAQLGKLVFNELEYNYSFSDSSYNSTVWVDGGVVINTDIGEIRFQIPFSPIEESTTVTLTKYLQNKSTAFVYGGLMDGKYDFQKNGSYHFTGRGLMRVNDSNVGRGYPAKSILTVNDNTISIQITVPLETKDYGFNIDRIHEKVLVDEIVVTITGSTKIK